jgi:energy-converting hydrogenase Eha subunit F
MTPPKIAAISLTIGILLGMLLFSALDSDQIEIAPGPSTQVQPG